MLRYARVQIKFKITHRYYWTPSRLSQLGFIDTSNCCRFKMEEGHLIHILWSCSEVQELWNRICDIPQEISGIQIPFNRPVILGDPSVLMGGDKHIIS